LEAGEDFWKAAAGCQFQGSDPTLKLRECGVVVVAVAVVVVLVVVVLVVLVGGVSGVCRKWLYITASNSSLSRPLLWGQPDRSDTVVLAVVVVAVVVVGLWSCRVRLRSHRQNYSRCKSRSGWQSHHGTTTTNNNEAKTSVLLLWLLLLKLRIAASA
jgi:uncharacterized membrane protein